MRIFRNAVLPALLGLAACTASTTDRTVDRGIDAKDLTTLKAGIWVDPNGCDVWIIDDGVEGYMSARLDRNGKPVCSGLAPPGSVVGPFRSGSDIVELF